jgi:hypothetical protein
MQRQYSQLLVREEMTELRPDLVAGVGETPKRRELVFVL